MSTNVLFDRLKNFEPQHENDVTDQNHCGTIKIPVIISTILAVLLLLFDSLCDDRQIKVKKTVNVANMSK